VDDAQQIFTWRNSNPTRYGLYVSTENISVTTLRRSIDIELETLDSIRVKVVEDVRLKIGVNAPWDGSYRKASALAKPEPPPPFEVASYADAAYNGIIGRVAFSPDGVYELSSGGTVQSGRYSFFALDGREMLELRRASGSDAPAANPRPAGGSGSERQTYIVRRPEDGGLSLRRVRIGAAGVQDMHEPAILLAPEARAD
jgi:hypothetical protein